MSVHTVSTSPSLKPEISYSVSEEDDIFNYNSISNKVERLALVVFSIIIFPFGLAKLIGKVIYKIVQANMNNESAIFRLNWMNHPAYLERCKSITIETADQVKLNTLMISNSIQEKKGISKRKYIIYLNGLGDCYEAKFKSLLKISNETDANIYTGNYRSLTSGGVKNFVMDAEAMVQYLLNLGVPQKNILIHGHSLGGVVGVHVAAKHQEQGKEMNICCDRIFASTPEFVQEYFNVALDRLAGVRNFSAKLRICILKILSFLAQGILRLSGWNFQILEDYNAIQGHKFMIYHKYDPKIPYNASLYKKLKNAQITYDELKQKFERKLERLQTMVDGSEIESNPQIERNYRPANALKFRNHIHGYPILDANIHDIGIMKTDQAENYKDQVDLALK